MLLCTLKPYAATADSVNNALKDAMRECVLDTTTPSTDLPFDESVWADVVSSSTGVAFAQLRLYGRELFGIDPNSDMRSAMVSRTQEVLFENLQNAGVKNFRRFGIEATETCMPIALAAAAEEMQRLEHAVCPDETTYLEQIEILTASESELRARFGNRADEIRDIAEDLLAFSLVGAFPEIFRHGQKKHPHLKGDDLISSLNDELLKIGTRDMSQTKASIDKSVTIIAEISRPLTERVKNLRASLFCLQDWMDRYPWDAVTLFD